MYGGCILCLTYASQYCIFYTDHVTTETFAGSGKGNSGNAKVAVEIPIALVAGKNTIDLLSLTVGLQVSLPAFIKSGKLFIATIFFIFNEYIIFWMIFFF